MNELICTVLIAMVAMVGCVFGYALLKVIPVIRDFIKSFIRWHFK